MCKRKLILLFIVICYINCKILRLQQCNKYHAQFSIVYRRKKLITSVSSAVKDADFTKCSTICLNYPKCKSISFKDDGSLCLIHHNSVNDEGFIMEDADGWTHAETPTEIENVRLPLSMTVKRR